MIGSEPKISSSTFFLHDIFTSFSNPRRKKDNKRWESLKESVPDVSSEATDVSKNGTTSSTVRRTPLPL